MFKSFTGKKSKEKSGNIQIKFKESIPHIQSGNHIQYVPHMCSNTQLNSLHYNICSFVTGVCYKLLQLGKYFAFLSETIYTERRWKSNNIGGYVLIMGFVDIRKIHKAVILLNTPVQSNTTALPIYVYKAHNVQ